MLSKSQYAQWLHHEIDRITQHNKAVEIGWQLRYEKFYTREEHQQAGPTKEISVYFTRQQHEELKHFCPICNPKPQKTRSYLVTFTHDPVKCTKEQWRAGLAKQLTRATLPKGQWAIEHPDTNIHCHVFVPNTTKTICHTNFNSFKSKYGNVDVRTVNQDNGVEAYIGKESEIKSFDNTT